jgi:hypothetical protein
MIRWCRRNYEDTCDCVHCQKVRDDRETEPADEQ